MRVPSRQGAEQEAQSIELLTQRIVSSQAHFFVMLEDHRMLQPFQLILDRDASSTLRSAGFANFCSEMDKNVHRLARNLRHLFPEPTDERMLLERRATLETPQEMLDLHMVGDSYITIEEAKTETSRQFKRDELLVEKFIIKPEAKIRAPQFRMSVSEAARWAFHKFFLNNDSPAALVSALENDLLPYRPDLERDIWKVSAGPSQFGIDLSQEIEVLRANYRHFRLHGTSDAIAVRNIFKVSTGKAIINYGYHHGVYTNPSSLAEQLVVQGKAMTALDVEVILLMEPKFAASIHRGISGQIEQGAKLRDSARVFDVTTGQEWSVRAWFDHVPSITPEQATIYQTTLTQG